MVKINETLPKEIHRSIRSLHHLAIWKGTEFRTVLLYAGFVVFKSVLPSKRYTLFLKLACAIRICSTDAYRSYWPLARTLLNEYIEEHISEIGLDSITSNIHHLSHIVDDIEHLGNLESINTYAFENQLFQMKSVIKQCNKSLEQLARRIKENEIIQKPFSFNVHSQYPKLSKQFQIENEPDRFTFKQIEYKENTILIDDLKNQWVLLNDNTIVKYEYAFISNREYFICGQPLKRTTDFFTEVFNSSYLDIFESDGECDESKNINIKNIKFKLFCIKSDDMFVYFPLLHT